MNNPPGQWEADNRVLQEALWGGRELILDQVLLHNCDIHEVAVASIRHVAWDPDTFVQAALRDDRNLLHFTDPEA